MFVAKCLLGGQSILSIAEEPKGKTGSDKLHAAYLHLSPESSVEKILLLPSTLIRKCLEHSTQAYQGQMMPVDLFCFLWRNGSWLGEKGRVVDVAYFGFIRLFDLNSMNYVLIDELDRYRFLEGLTEYMKSWRYWSTAHFLLGHWARQVTCRTSALVFCHCLMCSTTTWLIEKSPCQAWGRAWRGQGSDKGHRDLKKPEELADGKLVQFNKDTSIWGEQPHAEQVTAL